MNDKLNISSNSINIKEENIPQCLENEEVNTKTLVKKLPDRTQTAFSWKSYSNSKMVTNEVYSEVQKYQNSPNDTFSVINDSKEVRMLAYMQWSGVAS